MTSVSDCSSKAYTLLFKSPSRFVIYVGNSGTEYNLLASHILKHIKVDCIWFYSTYSYCRTLTSFATHHINIINFKRWNINLYIYNIIDSIHYKRGRLSISIWIHIIDLRRPGDRLTFMIKSPYLTRRYSDQNETRVFPSIQRPPTFLNCRRNLKCTCSDSSCLIILN